MHVNLVRVDETHVFKHAEDALQRHTTVALTLDFILNELDTHTLSLSSLPLVLCHQAESVACM